jgi:carbamoyltransferase
MTKDAKWQELFSLPRREKDAELAQEYMDLALAIQEVTNEAVVRLARTAKKLTGATNLVLAGGVALNCVSNFHLRESKLFGDIWIQPAAGDAGGALGAALAAYHLWLGRERKRANGEDGMRGAYLGPEFGDAEAETMARRNGAPYKKFATADELCGAAAGILAKGAVVGWFQGRMEWGPRALGNRSILADARNPEMQKKLNLKIKFREGFRPFAPSVLAEDSAEYFETAVPSPYMLFTAPVVASRRKPVARSGAGLYERLYVPRSDIPSVTHLDYSARLQTVSRQTNETYWKLISAFKKKTGYGVIINTSFNVRGEPIVMTPEEAYQCFSDTDMDYLVIGNLLFDKREQPKREKTGAPRAFAED